MLILRGFLKRDDFGPGGRQALCLRAEWQSMQPPLSMDRYGRLYPAGDHPTLFTYFRGTLAGGILYVMDFVASGKTANLTGTKASSWLERMGLV